MQNTVVYRINSPAVIGEVLDGEAIIVNLDTGAYYSLDGAGAVVWETAQAGAPMTDLIGSVVARFDGADAEIGTGVASLVGELVAEGLLVTCTGEGGTTGTPASSGGDRRPFVKPALRKFTDMADLLLLDPIHEVDGQGWPHPAPRP